MSDLETFLGWIGAIHEAAQRGYGQLGVLVDIYSASFGAERADEEVGLRIRLIGLADPPHTAKVERHFPPAMLRTFAGDALVLLTAEVERMGASLRSEESR